MTVIEAKGHSGTVVFDGATVTIRRDGGLGRAVVGKGRKQIPLASIAAVQWKPAGALVNGYIQFTIPGGVEVRSRAGSATVDAGRDENAVVFTKKQMPVFEQLRDAIQAAVAARGAGGGVPAAGPDVATRLRQLAELHETGIITPAEFEAKRAELLAQM